MNGVDPLHFVVRRLRLDWQRRLQELERQRAGPAAEASGIGAERLGTTAAPQEPLPLDPAAWMLEAIADLRAARLPLERLSLALVPERAGFLGAQHQWSLEEPERIRSFLRLYEFFLGEDHRTGVLHHVCCTGRIERLALQERAPEAIPFPLLRDLRRDQFRDYLAIPLPAAASHRLVLTLATRDAGGFTDADLRTLGRLLPTLRRAQQLSGHFGIGQLAPCDPLTGLQARHRCEEVLGGMLAERSGPPEPPGPCGGAAGTATGLSLLALDLDRFGAYNQVFGHHIADEALVTVARLLHHRWGREALAVARIGSDAFAMLWPVLEPEALQRLARQVQQAVQDLRLAHPPAPTPFLGCSVAGLQVRLPGGSEPRPAAAGEGDHPARAHRLLLQVEALLAQAGDQDGGRVLAAEAAAGDGSPAPIGSAVPLESPPLSVAAPAPTERDADDTAAQR